MQALGPFKLSATHIERLRLLATDFRYTLVPTEGGCVGDSVSGFSQPESKPTLFQRYCGKVLRAKTLGKSVLIKKRTFDQIRGALLIKFGI